jgi:hypothetical protein
MVDAPLPGGPPEHEPEATSAPARWWRVPLAATAIAVPVLLGAAGFRLGCEAGTLDLALCGNVEAPVAVAEAEAESAATRPR